MHCEECIPSIQALFVGFLGDPYTIPVDPKKPKQAAPTPQPKVNLYTLLQPAHWASLTQLVLTHNNFPKIDSTLNTILQHFQSLTVLNLSYNNITEIEDISIIPKLNFLDLSNNKIHVCYLIVLFL